MWKDETDSRKQEVKTVLPEEELTAHHECAGAQEIVFILKVQPIVLPFPETSSLSYTPRVLLYS